MSKTTIVTGNSGTVGIPISLTSKSNNKLHQLHKRHYCTMRERLRSHSPLNRPALPYHEQKTLGTTSNKIARKRRPTRNAVRLNISPNTTRSHIFHHLPLPRDLYMHGRTKRIGTLRDCRSRDEAKRWLFARRE
jgi:hypothetical protein